MFDSCSLKCVLFQGQQFPGVEYLETDHSGIHILELVCPLDSEELVTMNELFNPIAPSLSFGADIYCAVVQYAESAMESRQLS